MGGDVIKADFRPQKAGSVPHSSEAFIRAQEARLRSWRRILSDDRGKAQGMMAAAIHRMNKAGVFHYSEIARAAAHMKNGLAHPDEFGTSKAFGCPTFE